MELEHDAQWPVDRVIARRIRHAREAKNMTRRQFADAVADYLPTDTAWTPALIGSIERPGFDEPEDGRTRRVLARELLAFAWVLGVEPLWLAGHDGQDAQLDLGGEKPVTLRAPDGAFRAQALGENVAHDLFWTEASAYTLGMTIREAQAKVADVAEELAAATERHEAMSAQLVNAVKALRAEGMPDVGHAHEDPR